MKKAYFSFAFLLLLVVSCHTNKGVSTSTPEAVDKRIQESERIAEGAETKKPESVEIQPTAFDPSRMNPGIGPITTLTWEEEIDMALAEEGKELFQLQCRACHKLETRYIGPEMKGVIQRRNPVWIMNMILNTQEMIATDPDAKALMEEYLAPMNQCECSEADARAMVEYFRTL